MLKKLVGMPNVTSDFGKLVKQPPLVTGEYIPGFWCRTDGKSATIFFANPKTDRLSYPVAYGQSLQDSTITADVNVNFSGRNTPVKLTFKPYQSLLLNIHGDGQTEFDDIYFLPGTPVAEYVMENTFTSLEKVVNHLIPVMRVFTKFILRNRWNSEESIQEIRAPILFIKCLII